MSVHATMKIMVVQKKKFSSINAIVMQICPSHYKIQVFNFGKFKFWVEKCIILLVRVGVWFGFKNNN